MKRTTTEAELLRWVDEGKSIKEISKILGRHYSNTVAAMNILGIRSKIVGGRAKSLDFEALFAAMRNGASMNDCAEIAGLTTASLVSRLKKAGHPATLLEFWKREAMKGTK